MKRMIILIILGTSLLCGCSKEMDYELDTNASQKELNALDELKKQDTWEEKLTTEVNGKEVEVDIAARLRFPEEEALMVVEAEAPKLSADTKKNYLSALFGQEEIYYHEREHWTKGELEEKIEECRKMMEVDSLNADNYAEEINEYQALMQFAPEDHILAEDFSQCNAYLVYSNERRYEASFVPGEAEFLNLMIVELAGSRDSAPESVTGSKFVLFSTNGMAEGENQCSLSEEAAEAQADEIIKQWGFSSQVCVTSADVEWMGYDLADGGEMIAQPKDVVLVKDGYAFWYSLGVGNHSFMEYGRESNYHDLNTSASGMGQSASENIPDAEETAGSDTWTGCPLNNEISILLNECGLLRAELQWPLEATKITGDVPLLPMDSVKKMFRKEIRENGAAYGWDLSYVPYNSLDLIYIRIKDESTPGHYSFIPAWRLCYQQENAVGEEEYFYPIFVNAMDGSIIYWSNVK